MGRRFMNIDWKMAGNACIRVIKSLGRGDFLQTLRVYRWLPYIIHLVVLGILSIWLSFSAEKTMHRVETNKDIIESLKYDNANKKCELVGLSRISTVEKMLEASGSQVRIPEVPAYTIRK